MNRRESLKVLFVGGVASTMVLNSCVKNQEVIDAEVTKHWDQTYGRTAEEKAYDNKIFKEHFLNEHEFDTVKIVADIILPKQEGSYSASQVGVPEFIRFIVKDMPKYQLPMRGGLKWLDREASMRFDKDFKDLSAENQIAIVEDIAYPDDVAPQFEQGASFFSLMRDLTLTGYFTSKEGIEELGYAGNRANFWDGVPEEVLQKYNLSYDPKYLSQYITMDERNEEMTWDE